MSNDPKRDENGDRLFCDAWRGARTPEFRKFKRDFKASATKPVDKTKFIKCRDYILTKAQAV